MAFHSCHCGGCPDPPQLCNHRESPLSAHGYAQLLAATLPRAGCLWRLLSALPDSGHTWQLLQCLVAAGNCWRHLAPALGASRFVRARMGSSTIDASRHVLLTSCHILERVAALVERCSPRGALRPSWSAAVAVKRCGRCGLLRSLWGAAVHVERCGPR